MKTPKEESEYYQYGGRQRRDKLLGTLLGILEGINSDGVVTPTECTELREWIRFNSSVMTRPPFSSLAEAVERAVADGRLTEDERLDLIWLARNARSGTSYFDPISQDLQVLSGILHGILSDGRISPEELHALSDWQEENRHLSGMYPFDEIESAVTKVLEDGTVSDAEQTALTVYFSEFCNLSPATLSKSVPDEVRSASKQLAIETIYAIDPPLIFDGRSFCFTGQSTKCSRKELWSHVERRGGQVTNSIIHTLDFLVVCHHGSVCWTYCTFGRKIELVLNERKTHGRKTLIVREADFWDAVADN